jgi:hypothetical protein
MHLEWDWQSRCKDCYSHSTSENLENYYQEAGRSGRNEKKHFAVLQTHLILFKPKSVLHILPDKTFKLMYKNSVIFYKFMEKE